MTQPTNHSSTRPSRQDTIAHKPCGHDFGEHTEALLPEKMLRQAHILLAEHRFSEALIVARQGIETSRSVLQSPLLSSIPYHLVAGQCYYGLGDYNSAVDEFHLALTLSERLHDDDSTPVAILGNLGSAFAAKGDVPRAIDTFEERLARLERAATKKSLESSLVRALKIETLKELSALHFAEQSYERAEKFTYELAPLQEPGLDRGKTLVLLAQIFQASNSHVLALKTVINARSELLRGDAEYYEPLVLSNALRLEARLLLEEGELSASYERYDAAYQILKTVHGTYSFRTLLCACDRSLVDMHKGELLTSCDAIEASLELALQSTDLKSKAPLVRPYIRSQAMLSQRIAEAMLTAIEIVQSMPTQELTPDDLAKRLDARELYFLTSPLCARLSDYITDGSSVDQFIQSLRYDTRHYLNLALKRFMQVLSSLQEQFGARHPEIAPVYEKLRDVYFTLGEDSMAAFCDQQAANIKSQYRARDGSKDP